MKVRMDLLLFVCLFFVSIFAQKNMTHHGIMQVSKKSSFGRDMIHIIKTIFQNAKFGDYPDIKDEEKNGAFSKGMYLTDIEVTHVDFNYKALIAGLLVNHDEKTVTMVSKEPILKYTFAFKWKATAMGVHIAFGQGNATMTSENVAAVYKLLSKGSTLETAFKVEIKEITGVHALIPNVKDWAEKKMKEVVYPQLKHAINYNVHFIDTYMNSHLTSISHRIDEHHTIQYVSKPADIDFDNDFVFVAHNVSVQVNGKELSSVTQETSIPMVPLLHDIGIFISPQLIPKTIDIHGLLHHCDGEFDMSKVGLSGTLKDFFEPMPELVSRFSGDEKVKMFCEYAYQPLTEMAEHTLLFPVRCNFTSEESLVVSAAVVMKMKYSGAVTDDQNHLFGATLSNIEVAKIKSYPHSMDLSIFLMDVFNMFGKVKFENKVLDVPAIRYEPYRDYDNFEAAVVDNSYVAYYKELPEDY